MKFLIVSHTHHYKVNNQFYAYAPYVREMNLWLNHVDQVHIVAPLTSAFDQNINLVYRHQKIAFAEVPAFSLNGLKALLKTLIKLPKILGVIFKAMRQADHIHLRCPGNMGLLGCLVQIFFPSIPKTAKYAGNWDPKSKQPWSYKLQKWILSNTLLTKKMQVLVYGEWPKQSKNIKSFFTASYFEHEKQEIFTRNYTQKLKFYFVGSLSKGKQPQLAFEMIHQLRQKGIDVELHVYGNGNEKPALENWITKNEAQNLIQLHGNQPKHVIKKSLQYAHFLVLPSKSEGWPKVVAEAMFWGCIPVVTPISCVPWMLDHGNRGILIQNDLVITVKSIELLIKNPNTLELMSKKVAEWSRQYTLDEFEAEIRKLL